MSLYRKRGLRNKGTRPFMPLRGRKTEYRRRGDTDRHSPAEEQVQSAAADQERPEAEGQDYERLKAERDSYLDLARRERADFDNFRKRTAREMREIKRESLGAFLKEFFGPLDDLDRVLRESAKDSSYESLATGVKLMEENFWRALAKAGVEKIDAKGKLFDPTVHEAMAAVPSAEHPANTILEVYENGYKMDDFVLRPAKVVVSREP